MGSELHAGRSELIRITPLPQLVPSRVCLSCDVCCRFPERDSFLRPYFTSDEIRRAIARGIDPVLFPNPNGCQVSVVPILSATATSARPLILPPRTAGSMTDGRWTAKFFPWQ